MGRGAFGAARLLIGIKFIFELYWHRQDITAVVGRAPVLAPAPGRAPAQAQALEVVQGQAPVMEGIIPGALKKAEALAILRDTRARKERKVSKACVVCF